MMPINTKQAYSRWADQYDTNKNNTRDLEGQALRSVLAAISFDRCLEIGCGTGKNTTWLMQRAQQVTAVDLSEEMLAKAKEKITDKKVLFKQADIREKWEFGGNLYELVSFSLVLEHIENLDGIFSEVVTVLQPGGHVYIGELHPFKQYLGTKARFDTEEGQQIVECYNHHISDFIQTAKKHGLALVDVDEYFDNDDKNEVPRILTILFKKS